MKVHACPSLYKKFHVLAGMLHFAAFISLSSLNGQLCLASHQNLDTSGAQVRTGSSISITRHLAQTTELCRSPQLYVEARVKLRLTHESMISSSSSDGSLHEEPLSVVALAGEDATTGDTVPASVDSYTRWQVPGDIAFFRFEKW